MKKKVKFTPQAEGTRRTLRQTQKVCPLDEESTPGPARLQRRGTPPSLPVGMPPKDITDLQNSWDLGINTEEKLLRKSLGMRSSNLQKQRNALPSKQHRSEA